MSKNCAFLSVYKYSFIITCIKNVSFLALCLLSTPFHSFFSFLEGAFHILQCTTYSLFFLSSLQLAQIPAMSQKWLYFVKAPSLSPFIMFQQNLVQLTLFSGTLPIPRLCLFLLMCS